MAYKENGTYTTVCPRDCFGSCSFEVTVEEGKVIKLKGDKINQNSEGALCVKGASYVKRLSHPDRLKQPLLKDKEDGTFKPVSWAQALNLIADKLKKTKDHYGTEAVMYMNSWGHAGVFNNYANYFWSQYGTITSAYGGLCNDAGTLGIKYTYGNLVKHNNNDDLLKAKLIIVWGSNPANTNIHRMRRIKKAVANGSKLIVIDPRVSETMIEGAIRIHPRGGTDGLLAIGVAKALVEKGLCDEKFIKDYVLGYEAYKKHLEEYSIPEILQKTELAASDLEAIVSAIEENPIYALITGTGKSRYSNGGQTERCVCVLPALTGSVGVSGGGFYFTDNQAPKLKWPKLNEEVYESKARVHVGKIGQDLEGLNPKVRFLWIEKANPVTSSPNTNAMRKTIGNVGFTVVVEHFMTDTAKVADLVLPAAMFAEKDDLISVYGDAYIHLLQKLVDPPGECKSESDIFRALGKTMGYDMTKLPVVDRDYINSFLAFNGLDITYEMLTEKPYLMETYNEIAFEDKVFETPSGKIEIYSEQMLKWQQDPLPTFVELAEGQEASPQLYEKYPLHFLSTHPKERINSQFIEMKLSPKHLIPEVEINPEDARRRNIQHGDKVRVFNDHGELIIIAHVTSRMKKGMVNIFEGWDQAHGACANKLIYGRETDIGHGTAYYDCLVEIESL